MAKKIVGYVAVVAVIIIVVLVVMNAGGYKSLLPENLFSSSAPEDLVIEVEPVQLDSLEEWDDNVEMPDSLINRLFNRQSEEQE